MATADFGYKTVGATSNDFFSNYVIADGPYSPANNGTLVSMSIYTNYREADCSHQGAIYDSSGNLIDTTEIEVQGGGAGWITCTATNGATLYSTTSYYLAFNRNKSAYLYSNGTSTSKAKSSTTFETWPDPITFSNYTGRNLWAIYATYEVAPSGTNIKINVGDAWKTVSALKVNVGDAWKTVSSVKVNVGDAWKTVF